MIVGTPESRALCAEIAELTDTVILGFSRGKDSVAAALWLKEFFPKLILFHKDGCPGMPMVERSLQYYEDVLGFPIERCIASSWFEYVASLQCQLIEDEDAIDDMELQQYMYEGDDMVAIMRAKYRAPTAWMAWGLSFKDNPIRRLRWNLRDGLIESSRVLYPCFDWTKSDVLQAIESAGVKLPEDYHYGNRSFNDIVNPRHFARMREQSPEDFEAIKLQFPLIEAMIARLHFRNLHFGVKVTTEEAGTTQSTSEAPKPVKRKPRAAVKKDEEWPE